MLSVSRGRSTKSLKSKLLTLQCLVSTGPKENKPQRLKNKTHLAAGKTAKETVMGTEVREVVGMRKKWERRRNSSLAQGEIAQELGGTLCRRLGLYISVDEDFLHALYGSS